MAGLLSIPLFAAVVVFQATVLSEFRIGGGVPDLMFTLVLAWNLLAGFEHGVTWALVAGILHDLISDIPVGTTSLALVLTLGLLALTIGPLNPRNLIYPALLTPVATLIMHMFLLVLLAQEGRTLPLGEALTYVTLPTVIYNTAMMPFVYRILGRIYMATRPRRAIVLE